MAVARDGKEGDHAGASSRMRSGQNGSYTQQQQEERKLIKLFYRKSTVLRLTSALIRCPPRFIPSHSVDIPSLYSRYLSSIFAWPTRAPRQGGSTACTTHCEYTTRMLSPLTHPDPQNHPLSPRRPNRPSRRQRRPIGRCLHDHLHWRHCLCCQKAPLLGSCCCDSPPISRDRPLVIVISTFETRRKRIKATTITRLPPHETDR